MSYARADVTGTQQGVEVSSVDIGPLFSAPPELLGCTLGILKVFIPEISDAAVSQIQVSNPDETLIYGTIPIIPGLRGPVRIGARFTSTAGGFGFRMLPTGTTTQGEIVFEPISYLVNNQFTTPAAPGFPAPIPETDAVTSVNATGATLNGKVNPNGTDNTVGWFDVLSSSTGGSEAVVLTTAHQPIPDGSTAQPFSISVSGLQPATQYWARAAGSSAGGTVLADDVESFTTSAAGAGGPTVTVNAPTSITSTTVAMCATGTAPNSAVTITFEYRSPAGAGVWVASPYGALRQAPHTASKKYWSTTGACTPGATLEYRCTFSNAQGTQTSGPTASSTVTLLAANVEETMDQNAAGMGVTGPTWRDPRDHTSGLITKTAERITTTSNSQRTAGASTGGSVFPFDIRGYGFGNPAGKTPGTVEVYWESPYPNVYTPSNTPALASRWITWIGRKAKAGDRIAWQGMDGSSLAESGSFGPIFGGYTNGATPGGRDVYWKPGAAYVPVHGLTFVGDGTVQNNTAVLELGEPACAPTFESRWGGCNNIYFQNFKILCSGTTGGGHNVICSDGSHVGLAGYYDCTFRNWGEGTTQQAGHGTRSNLRSTGRMRLDIRRPRASYAVEHFAYGDCWGSDSSGIDSSFFMDPVEFVHGSIPVSADSKYQRPVVTVVGRSSTTINDGSIGPAGRGSLIVTGAWKNVMNPATPPGSSGFLFAFYGHLGDIEIDCPDVDATATILILPNIAKGAWIYQAADGNWYAHKNVRIIRFGTTTCTDSFDNIGIAINGTYQTVIDTFDLDVIDGMTIDLFEEVYRGTAWIGTYAGVPVGENGSVQILAANPLSAYTKWGNGGKMRYKRGGGGSQVIYSNAQIDQFYAGVVRPNFASP